MSMTYSSSTTSNEAGICNDGAAGRWNCPCFGLRDPRTCRRRTSGLPKKPDRSAPNMASWETGSVQIRAGWRAT